MQNVERPFFFFNDTATTEIYTLSLHDALPISAMLRRHPDPSRTNTTPGLGHGEWRQASWARSEEHTSELQSRQYLVCRLLLEKKKLVALHPSGAFPSFSSHAERIVPPLVGYRK